MMVFYTRISELVHRRKTSTPSSEKAAGDSGRKSTLQETWYDLTTMSFYQRIARYLVILLLVCAFVFLVMLALWAVRGAYEEYRRWK